MSGASAPPEIPASLRALMAEIGPRWGASVTDNVNLMVARFSEVLAAAPTAGMRVIRDLAYGPHERQRLDVFLPESGAAPFPTILFVHGGAFVSGHRNRTPEIYANVLHYFARHGIAGVNIGYRLADVAAYPGATLDIAAATEWIHAHADSYRLDRGRLFMMAHSAGAAHAGAYAYDERFRPAGGSRLAGFVVVSGRVRADVLPENPNADKVRAYYGDDPAALDDRSPVSHAGPDSIPTFVAWAQYENPLIDVYCAELVYRLAAAKRRAPPSLWLRGHNHTSAIAHFNTAEDALGRAIRAFVDAPS